MEKVLKVFISYSWDSEIHKNWVLNLANYLIKVGGCDVILDQYDLKTGGNMTHFMEKSFEEADKILLILTPNYKLKADKRQGGVGMEYSMISQGLYTNQTENTKFIPILREGSLQTSAPTYVQTTLYHSMKEDSFFDTACLELLRIIHNKPKLVKPERGNIPDFSESKKSLSESSHTDEFVAIAGKILKEKQLNKELEQLYKSEEGVKLVIASATRIFESIQRKASSYSKEINHPIQSEIFNDYNSLRLQAGDYYAIFDYVGYTTDNLRLISIRLSAGIDKNYTPNNNSNNIVSTLLREYINKNSIKIFPRFNNHKKVYWELDDSLITENEVVGKMFSLLLDAIKES